MENLFPVVQYLGQDLLGAFGLGLADRGFKHGNKILHLGLGQPGIHCSPKMETKLSPGACHIGKGGYGGQFPVLVADDITHKEIRKQVLL